jgi:hypothetical protein
MVLSEIGLEFRKILLSSHVIHGPQFTMFNLQYLITHATILFFIFSIVFNCMRYSVIYYKTEFVLDAFVQSYTNVSVLILSMFKKG